MTKTKSTKRALLLSALSLLMCVSMLIGSTFAWFTDSVTSGRNKIVSGNLDVVLEYKTPDSQDEWKEVTSDTVLFGEKGLWEPGHTEVVALRIRNAGTLALKYDLATTVYEEVAGTNVYGDSFKLSDHLEIGYSAINGDGQIGDIFMGMMLGSRDNANSLTNSEFGKSVDNPYPIIMPGDAHVCALAISMPTTVGNEANYKTGTDAPFISFGVTLLATQATVESDSFNNQYDYAASTAFVGGKGTADAPYLINEASQLLSISDYDEYTYFKVADGVETLDMTGVGKIKLNGSFDGNGVTMNNLTTALFQSVGKSGVAQDIKISNLTANVNVTDGSALVKNIYNSGETTFENVTLHGYIEGQYNMGSFYNYGTANAGDSDGADYTVNFVNTKSDATLVCTTGNAIGGMLGHGYEGADYTLRINMDANSGYTGDMYTTGTATCYKVMAMCSHATYVLNGTEVSRYNDTYPSTRLTKSAPTAGTDGYYVAPIDGVDHYVVYLNSQLTAYDANGNKIANKAGMTWNLGKETIASSLDGKVFDLITSANIVNDTANDLGYAMNNGELTIYSGRSDNYASGWVTLQVNQYDANGVLLATGITTVHTFAEP